MNFFNFLAILSFNSVAFKKLLHIHQLEDIESLLLLRLSQI